MHLGVIVEYHGVRRHISNREIGINRIPDTYRDAPRHGWIQKEFAPDVA